MMYLLLGIALSAFTVGTVMFYRFSKVTGRSVQSPFTPMFFFDALFFGLGSRRDMNIAACAFMVFLLSVWGLTYIKLRTNFWGKPRKLFWFRDCRNFLSDNALSLWCKGCCYQK
ncbi:hypothetical protein OHD33_26800 [Escherichia coli]|nr:hypothetical protein [Escherichia coli]